MNRGSRSAAPPITPHRAVASFVLRRLVFAVALLFATSLATYVLFAALPSDPAALTCGKSCTPERIEANRHRLGYDKPILEQYVLFLRGIVAGRTYGEGSAEFTCPAPSLGYSFNQQACVTDLLVDTLPVTASIAIGGFVAWMVLGVGLGVVAAKRRGQWPDRAVAVFSAIGNSFPTFFLALLLLFVFVIWTELLPFPSWVSPFDDPIRWLQAMVLPWATLAIISAPFYIRVTRFGMLETVNEDYVRLGIAKGLSERIVTRRYVLRGVMVPLVTIAALDLGATLGGAIFVESVFSLPGVGRLFIRSVSDSDLPVLVATTLVSAVFIVLANLVVDLLYGVLDPRVRSEP